MTSPAARVKRAFPKGLPASPVFTGLPDLPACKPPVYGRLQPACLQSPYLRGFPASLPANARLIKATEAIGLERPKDTGSRPTSHCVPLRPAGLCLTHISGAPPAAGTKHKDELSGALMPVIPPAARAKHHRPKRSRRDRKTHNNTCPAARVKRAFPEGLPASPVFTWASDLSIGKPGIYGHPRFACLRAHCLRASPAGLSSISPFTRVSGQLAGKWPMDKGCRGGPDEMPKRRGIRKEDLATWKGFCSAISG